MNLMDLLWTGGGRWGYQGAKKYIGWSLFESVYGHPLPQMSVPHDGGATIDRERTITVSRGSRSFACHYCGNCHSVDDMEIDHYRPECGGWLNSASDFMRLGMNALRLSKPQIVKNSNGFLRMSRNWRSQHRIARTTPYFQMRDDQESREWLERHAHLIDSLMEYNTVQLRNAQKLFGVSENTWAEGETFHPLRTEDARFVDHSGRFSTHESLQHAPSFPWTNAGAVVLFYLCYQYALRKVKNTTKAAENRSELYGMLNLKSNIKASCGVCNSDRVKGKKTRPQELWWGGKDEW